MALFLGIDVGTSATKGLLCDEAGRVLATASAPYPLLHPHPGWSEQDPSQWWRATITVTRSLAASAGPTPISAIGLSGQMHGAVLLDAAALATHGSGGAPLRHAILWNDQRTAPQCAQIEAAIAGPGGVGGDGRDGGEWRGRRRLVERVGNAALPGFTLPKLLWVQAHEPQTWAQVAAVMLPKDFVRWRLTGQAATDVGDASGTLLLDVHRRDWSPEMGAAANIDPAILPRAVESGETAGHLTPWAAAATGLAEGTPIIAGSGDNMMGAIGAGIVREGLIAATLGTSGVIYAHSDRPLLDLGERGGQPGRVHTMCAASPRGWCNTGCMLSAGGALAWARNVLAPAATFDDLAAEAAAAPAGCEGLVFLPYLTGERCPHPDPAARAGWIGLTSRHTRAHLLRAVMEGVTFGMGQVLDLFRGIGVKVERVRLGGGGARSALWRQMQADVYGVPIALTNTEEGPAYGAALLAGVAAGAWASIQTACDAVIREAEHRGPSPATAAAYAPAQGIYARLYTDLSERFAEMNAASRP